MSQAELERALRVAGIEAVARWEETTGSTNATALAMAAEGAPEWTLVGAGHQSEGRGRHGREWIDRQGDLLVSVLLRPVHLRAQDAGLLALLAGASMAGAAQDVTGMPVRCKWPNDLLLGEAKAGGILGESVLDGEGGLACVVLGSGVNLMRPEDVPGAEGVGKGVDRAELLGEYLRRFRAVYGDGGQLGPEEGRRGDGFPGRVIEAWSEVAATLGSEVEATLLDGSVVRGMAAGLDGRGRLIVDGPGGRFPVDATEVRHLRPSGFAGPETDG